MSALLLKALDNSKRSNASFLSNGPCLLSRRRLLAECRDHHCNNCNSQGGFGHVCDANSQKCSSVMALCYNFTRVLNILGFERFVAYMAAKTLAARKYTRPICSEPPPQAPKPRLTHGGIPLGEVKKRNLYKLLNIFKDLLVLIRDCRHSGS